METLLSIFLIRWWWLLILFRWNLSIFFHFLHGFQKQYIVIFLISICKENLFSYIFFLVFVFIVVVVLMNLLNGLAVSDTGIYFVYGLIIAKLDSKIVIFMSQVETISYIHCRCYTRTKWDSKLSVPSRNYKLY